MANKKILIIGGVASGAGAAARIRRLDEKAEIIMYEMGPDISFSNCGLPYHISGHISKLESLLMMTPEEFITQYNIIAKPLHEVLSINSKKKTLTIKDIANDKEIEETYDEVVISSGCRAIDLDIPGKENIPTFQLKNVEDLKKLMKHISNSKNKHVTVIGGGFIGIEVAENLVQKGIKVTLLEAKKQILDPFDFDIVQTLQKEALQKKIDLKISSVITKIEKDQITINGKEVIKTSGVLFSVGVIPNSEFASKSGVKVNSSNHIIVDKSFKTNLPNVYAAGDVIEIESLITKNKTAIPLAGLANKQGRYIADSIYSKKVLQKGAVGSSVVQVFDWTGATTGLNEKQIKLSKSNFDYEVVNLIPMTAVAIMPEAKPLHMKVIFDKKTNLILGAQATSKGIGAEKRIDVIATAMKFGAKIADLIDLELCYAPPYGTGKDAVNFVGYISSNLIDGAFKQIHYYEIEQFLNDNNSLVIDIREKYEWEAGHLVGSSVINIPMSEIRQNLDKISKDKNIYVHCRSGQRSYNVTLYLQSVGYKNVFNVSSGFLGISYYFDTLEKLYSGNKIVTKPNFN